MFFKKIPPQVVAGTLMAIPVCTYSWWVARQSLTPAPAVAQPSPLCSHWWCAWLLRGGMW